METEWLHIRQAASTHCTIATLDTLGYSSATEHFRQSKLVHCVMCVPLQLLEYQI